MTLRVKIATNRLMNAAAMFATTLVAFPCGAAGLEGWWRFAETDGDESADSSGHGRVALVDTNRVWRVAAAPGGGALWFDGGADADAATAADAGCAYALVPAFEGLTLTNAFTASAWIWPDAIVPFAPIISRAGDADAWDDGFALYVRGDGAIGAYVRSCADANAASGGSLATNAWSHVAMTYSGTELRLYLNGREVASRSFAGGASADAPAPLAVGTLVGADGVRPFSGAIADVRVWSSELSAAEVTDVCRQFVGEALDPDGDADGDGMPNGWEILHALDPHDASDAGMDSDGDGMSNLEEFVLGRNPRVGARPATLIYSASASPL